MHLVFWGKRSTPHSMWFWFMKVIYLTRVFLWYFTTGSYQRVILFPHSHTLSHTVFFQEFGGSAFKNICAIEKAAMLLFVGNRKRLQDPF